MLDYLANIDEIHDIYGVCGIYRVQRVGLSVPEDEHQNMMCLANPYP